MFYNYLIFSMVALSLCILKKHFVSLVETFILEGLNQWYLLLKLLVFV